MLVLCIGGGDSFLVQLPLQIPKTEGGGGIVAAVEYSCRVEPSQLVLIGESCCDANHGLCSSGGTLVYMVGVSRRSCGSGSVDVEFSLSSE
jgi:hypothetical protein